MKILSLLLMISPLAASAAPAEEPALACELGPVQRTFNQTAWNIYACADGKTAVVVPAQVAGSEFGYFFLRPAEGKVLAIGEGWGEDSSFRPVHEELLALTVEQLAAIVQAAQAASGARSAP